MSSVSQPRHGTIKLPPKDALNGAHNSKISSPSISPVIMTCHRN
jgi:hypothetical protein